MLCQLFLDIKDEVIDKIMVLEEKSYLYLKIRLQILESADLYLSVNKNGNSLRELISTANELISNV